MSIEWWDALDGAPDVRAIEQQPGILVRPCGVSQSLATGRASRDGRSLACELTILHVVLWRFVCVLLNERDE
jgi:hypothetical protein